MAKETLNLEQLRTAVAGRAAAFRSITEYQPVAGEGSKVFPASYAGGVYAFEHRRMSGSEHLCVILDSVASQANRMEEALLDAWNDDAIPLPVISVDFSSEFADIGKITSLDAPHRIADAILRYATTSDDKAFFSRSRYADLWRTSSIHNATALLELCPTALIFGTWGSPEATGVGPKFQRIIVSELVGIDAIPGAKTTSRIDPTGIRAGVELYVAAEDSGDLEWTTDEKLATTEKGKLKSRKPSEIVLGNIAPSVKIRRETVEALHEDDLSDLEKRDSKKQENRRTIADPLTGGGVTISRALQFTTISLPALRRLRFPKDGQRDANVDVAARTALAALALCAATLARQDGADLRSRCHLVATSGLHWELVGKPGEPHLFFDLDGDGAIALLNEAVSAATTAGLLWHEEEIKLLPSRQLVAAIRLSRDRRAGEETE